MAASILAICVFEDKTVTLSEIKISDLRDMLQSLEWEKLAYLNSYSNRSVARKKTLSEQIREVKAELKARSKPPTKRY